MLSVCSPDARATEGKPRFRLLVPHTAGGIPMTINIGDKIPSVTLKQLTPEGVKEVTTDEIFRGKKVVLLGVPGAFTPACSQRHLPGFVDRAADIKAKGVDEIACVAVNDAFVMGAWGREQKAEGRVRMLADGSGDFARSLGLELDLTKGGLGIRSQRYSMLVDDGVVKSLNVEKQPGQVDASGAEAMLKAL
jgi:peroxiredoxin